MLGGSEFRLRQGFAYGKTLVTPHIWRLVSYEPGFNKNHAPRAGTICHISDFKH
jgi:hypothetical protein